MKIKNRLFAAGITALLIFSLAITGVSAMQIYIQLNIYDGTVTKHITLEVEPTDTITDVKEKIYAKESIPAEHQLLVYQGKELIEGENNTLQDFSVEKDSVLSLYDKTKLLPDQSQFVMASQLSLFNTDDHDGTISAAKIYFGENNQQWWIAGSQSENTIVLFSADNIGESISFAASDSDHKYGDKTVNYNHYGASLIREYLNNNVNYFDVNEKAMIEDSMIYTDDSSDQSVYATHDQLYLGYGIYGSQYFTVGENSPQSLNDGLRVDSKYWGNDSFWLRTPSFYDIGVSVIYKDYEKVDSFFYANRFGVRPAMKINLSSLLFASSAAAADTSGSLQLPDVDDEGAFTPRYRSDALGTAKISYDHTKVTVSDVPAGTYLVVQNRAFAYAKAVSGNQTVTAADMNVENFENCQVWLETTNGRITKATLATVEQNYHINIAGNTGLNIVSDNGNQVITPGQAISSMTVEVQDGYYLDSQYFSNFDDFYGLTVTKTANGFIISGIPQNDVDVILPQATACKDGGSLIQLPDSLLFQVNYHKGLKLSDVSLDAYPGWKWVNQDIALLAGKQSYLARFDTTNYENEYDFNGVSGYNKDNHYVEKNLTVSVSKADSKLTITTSSLDKKYDGNAVSNPDVEKTGTTKDVAFTWYQKEENDWKELASSPTNAGSYKVVANVEADDNYNGASAELEFVISQTANEWTNELSIKGWTYGDKVYAPTAKSKYGTVAFTYSDTKDGAYTDTVPTNAGTWYVKATVAGNENYTGLEAIAEFTIEKANTLLKFSSDNMDKKYDGKPVNNPDVEKTGSTKDVTFTWYQKDGDGWKELSSSPTNAGSYKVVASVEADNNYNGTSAELEFVIDKSIPQFEVPTDLTVEQGQALSTVKLPDGFAWKDATQTANTLGKQTFKAIYTPEDTENYQTVEMDITVNVVAKAVSADTIDKTQHTGVETGDSTNVFVWSVLLMMSLAGAVSSVLFRRRNQR